MIAALLYLQYHSTKNRLLRQLKRLKQPKYLVFAIIGAIYFYFYFFRYVVRPRGNSALALTAPTLREVAVYESLGALVLLVLMLGAWIVPHQRAALTFTEAEIAFLFPAPVTRRGLIHFKLLRSQIAILFTILFLTLVANRFGGRAWIHAAGWWVALSTLNLHFLGSSFARTMLLDRGITNWQRRLAVLGLVAVLLGAVVWWAAKTIPPPDFSAGMNIDAIKGYVEGVLISGPMPYVLLPFRLITRPFFSPDTAAFFAALGPALAFNALQYWWVVRSDVAFEEASVEASQRLAEKITAIRQSGGLRSTAKVTRVKRPPFTLRPIGAALTGIFWKNLISAGQVFSMRTWFILATLIVVASIALGSSSRGADWTSLLGAFMGMLCSWAFLLGPQFLRQDFRQDLRHADILKLFPMRGWQVALGEILAPMAILTAIQWLLVLAGMVLVSHTGKLSVGLIFGLGFSAAVVFPMINGILLVIPNAAVLLFPAWFQSGKGGPQGVEATGQRLISMLGQVLVFMISLIPAVAVFAGIFFTLRFLVNMAVALPMASLAAAAVLGIEAGLGVMLLGWLFERFDLSAELPT